MARVLTLDGGEEMFLPDIDKRHTMNGETGCHSVWWGKLRLQAAVEGQQCFSDCPVYSPLRAMIADFFQLIYPVADLFVQ